MHVATPKTAGASGVRVGVAVSRYHDEITSKLEKAARSAFAAAGGAETDLVEIQSPGAFELVAICAALAARGDIDAVVALGCVISGQTRHDRYLAHAVAQGLAQLSIIHRKPVAFGVLTCPTIERAQARAGGKKGNKGAEAMTAALEAHAAIMALDAMASPSRRRTRPTRKRAHSS